MAKVPLELAATKGDASLVGGVLAVGTDVKAVWEDCRDQNLLCAAIQGGNHKVVSRWLKAGTSDLNVCCGQKGRSPLYLAALDGHEIITKLLLAAGAEVDRVDCDGNTALQFAVCSDNDAITQSCWLEEPTDVGAQQSHEKIVSLLLLNGADVNMSNNMQHSPFILAAKCGHLGITMTLLRAKADARDFSSAFAMAASRGHAEVMKYLVQHGADVRPSQLFHAARRNQWSVVDFLLEARINVNVRTSDYKTLLHFACRDDSIDTVTTLLRHKTDVNAKDCRGWTPLKYACHNIHPNVADLLLRWDADETSVSDGGLCAEQHLDERLAQMTLSTKMFRSIPCVFSIESVERRFENAERVRRLLANAPSNRAWRRRGLLVLCRAFLDKARIASTNVPAVSGAQKDNMSDRSAVKVRNESREGGVDEVVGGADGLDTGTTSPEGARDEASGSLCSVEASVVGLEQDGLFRHIVSFL